MKITNKLLHNKTREETLVKNKVDKTTAVIKTATRVVIGAAIVFVFIRNAFPTAEKSVVIENADISSQAEIPLKNASVSQDEISSLGESSDLLIIEESSQSSSEESDISQNSSDERDNSAAISASEPNVSKKININTAPASELVRLKGIGEVKAAAIIKYRNENGGFKSVDELINVSGIGKKTLEKIHDYVTI